MMRYLKFLLRLNWKTVYFNLKYFPFRQAIKLPVLLHRNVYLRSVSGQILLERPAYTGMIRIGFPCIGIFDEKRSRTIWEVYGDVIITGKTDIGHGSKISVGKNATLRLGNNFTISAETSIVANKMIYFGNDCLLSWDTLIMDSDLHTITNYDNQVINHDEDIFIGNKVWIGCRCMILKGAFIPDGCVIGAGSVITRDKIPTKSIYCNGRQPYIKQDISWDH